MTIVRDLGLIFITSKSKKREHYYEFACEADGCKNTFKRRMTKGRPVDLCHSCASMQRKNKDCAKKHGMSNTKLYWVWTSMRQRCNNSKHKRYSDYGGRGIAVCEEWNKYQSFYDWAMSNGYTAGLTLDREDNDGNYNPENCRFATYTEQNNNRRKFK